MSQAFMGAIAASCLFTVFNWSMFVRRIRGQRVEKRAFKKLKQAVNSVKEASAFPSVQLKGGGDADAVVILKNNKFNIEIKSVQDPKLVTIKHAVQTLKAASELQSIPVIWLPESRLVEVRERHGVRVYCGDAKGLIKFMVGLL